MEMQQIVEILAKLQASQNDNLARMEAKMDSNQKKAEADKEEMLTRMKEEMKANQEDLLARKEHLLQHILSHINQSTQILPEAKKTGPTQE
jgi:glycerol-3-phosphate dehydrogenase